VTKAWFKSCPMFAQLRPTGFGVEEGNKGLVPKFGDSDTGHQVVVVEKRADKGTELREVHDDDGP